MEHFEHFELQRELGRGATAKIYLARNTKTNAQVSLKIFHPKMFHDPQFAQRIQREIKLSASLKHENIVQVLEVITHTDPPALVMDYIDGQNLENFQSRLPYILPEVSALIVVEILKGLEYAHAQNLVHRDLKPENVLIRKDGRVFVTDFGLAKLADTTLITQANVILGSLDYMSPEQSLGDSVTPSSDLFSVAVILYFLTTGTRPFSRETTLATLQAIREEEAEHPAKRNPKLSTELSRIIQKGLSKRPDQRFASAKEFREALESYLTKLGFGPGTFTIENWIREPTGMTMEGLRLTVERLTQHCERSLKERKKDDFLETLAHLTLKAPQSPAIARLTTAYREAREVKRKPIYIGLSLTVLLLGPCSYWYWKKPAVSQVSDTRPTPTPIPEKKPAPAVAPAAEVAPLTQSLSEAAAEREKALNEAAEERQKALEAAKITAAEAAKRAKPAGPKYTGVVHFNVQPGVQVFWDGKEIDASVPLPNQRVGEHQVMLVSPGFEPIRGKVNVKDRQPTVVNAR